MAWTSIVLFPASGRGLPSIINLCNIAYNIGKPPLFQRKRLLVPILPGQVPRWQRLVATIPFTVGKGVEVNIEERSDLSYGC